MQYGNRYSVHISSYGWCFDWGEFKTLEEANECFYDKIRDEVEEKDADHQHRFYVYMLEWSKDLSYHKEIRCWSVEEGYKIDFPRKPKSIFKILKQLYIKHKVEERRRKGTMSKFAETVIDSGKGGVCVVDEMLDDMKTLKECINDLQKDCENKAKTIDNFTDKLATLNEKITELEKEKNKYKARCEHYEKCIMQMREEND